MIKQITVILNRNFVARWFEETLRNYSRMHGVEIVFACKKTIDKPGVSLEKWLPKNISRFWSCKKIDKCLSPGELKENESILLFCNKKDIPPGLESSDVWIVEEGNEFIAPGLRGWFLFFKRFFWLGHPMILTSIKTHQRFSIFFQTRDFKLSRNLGFIRYNLDKILDFLSHGKPHGYPAFSESDQVKYPLVEYFRYPLWQFQQKIKRKVLNARWQLVKMSRKSLARFTSVDETLMSSVSGQGWADPFIADSETGVFLFFEEIVKGKGRLSVMELDRKSLVPQGNPITVLEKETHLSYPFVFKIEGEWYMIPENSAARDLSIYHAETFPYKWKHFKTVFSDSKWVDTTPFYYREKWWIFSVSKGADYSSSYQDLHVFYCDDILKDNWLAHPSNPVVSDVRHARGGGAVFFYEGKLIRPAQNCHNKYGGGLQFCEIIKLSEEDYDEKILGEFRFPLNKPMSSFHTIALYEDYIIGDCYV